MRDYKVENETLAKDPLYGPLHAAAIEEGKTLLQENPILKKVDMQKLLYCLTKYKKVTLAGINSVVKGILPLSDEQKVSFITNVLNVLVTREGKLVDIFCLAKGNELSFDSKKNPNEKRSAQKLIVKYGSKLKQITLWDSQISGYKDLVPGRGYKVTFNENKNELFPVDGPMITPTDAKLDMKEVANLIFASFPVLKPPFSTAVKNVLYYVVGMAYQGNGPFYTIDINQLDAQGQPVTFSAMNMPSGLSGQLVLVVGNIVPSTYEENGYTMFVNYTLTLSGPTPQESNGTKTQSQTSDGVFGEGFDPTL
jgi:hypothetical protein